MPLQDGQVYGLVSVQTLELLLLQESATMTQYKFALEVEPLLLLSMWHWPSSVSQLFISSLSSTFGHRECKTHQSKKSQYSWLDLASEHLSLPCLLNLVEVFILKLPMLELI